MEWTIFPFRTDAAKEVMAMARHADRVAHLRYELRDLQQRFRVPMLFYASTDTPGSCMCPDETALAALQVLGEVSTLRKPKGGRLWVSRPIA
jgi:hypothetical protein